MAKILIVEDNDMLNKAYAFMLKAKGHTVESSFDGYEGLEIAGAFNPEIILLDYLMPKIDGKEFLIRYNLKELHPTVKVILLTNISEDDKIREAMELGVHKYFLKSQMEPFQLVEIVEKMDTNLPPG